MKKIIAIFLVLFGLFSCVPERSEQSNVENKKEVESQINVVSSIVPLASIVAQIGGDMVSSTVIVPAGVSPHGFDLKPKNMIEITNSDLMVVLGLEHIDGFLEKSLEGKNTLKVSDGIELLESTGNHDHHHDEHEDNHHDEHEEESHEEEGHSLDPHIWSSPKNAKVIAKKIQDELTKIAPEKSEIFQANYDDFFSQLDEKKQSFLSAVKDKNQKEFIIFHDAHNYLFTDLGIDQEKKLVFRENVMDAANSQEMKEIIDEITLHGVKNVFVEPQFQNSGLEKLVEKYNLELHILDPLGSSIQADGYINNLSNNIENLQNIYE